jgi:hypothetical protein
LAWERTGRYYTAGANILLTMRGNLYFNLEYSKPLTAFMKAKQSDLTMIAVGYSGERRGAAGFARFEPVA